MHVQDTSLDRESVSNASNQRGEDVTEHVYEVTCGYRCVQGVAKKK
jgi:hypothetical protein